MCLTQIVDVNVGLLLGQRRRRWPNNKSTLGQRIVFAPLMQCLAGDDESFVCVCREGYMNE